MFIKELNKKLSLFYVLQYIGYDIDYYYYLLVIFIFFNQLKFILFVWVIIYIYKIRELFVFLEYDNFNFYNRYYFI